MKTRKDWCHLLKYSIIGLAFMASTGVALLILGCALEQFNNWFPMFVLVTYFLCPVPYLISKRSLGDDAGTNLLHEIMMFITAVIVVSAYCLPILLARVPIQSEKHIIQWGAAAFVMSGNTIVFITILIFFLIFQSEDSDYSNW